MSDVLIRGMEMPRNCHECEVGGSAQMDDVDGCVFYHFSAGEQEAYHDRTPENCPLVPIPPHGRLIDADELLNDSAEVCEDHGDYTECGVSHQQIADAPTIIPASK